MWMQLVVTAALLLGVVVPATLIWIATRNPLGVPPEHQDRPSAPPGPLQEGGANWPQGPGMR